VKLNHVFDYLDVTRYYNGLVLLLEDDHYVVKDLISVLHQMYRLRQRYFFSLLTYLHAGVLLMTTCLLFYFSLAICFLF